VGNATAGRYRPPFWGTLAFIVGGGLCITAGFWQLDRAAGKQALFAAFEQGLDGEPLQAVIADENVEQYLYRRISLRGHYVPDRQILLDSMMHEGRPGYHVLTPLRTGATTILVNRGWLRADPDRTVMPDVAVTDRMRTVTGRLYRLPRTGLSLGATPTGTQTAWPLRLLFPSAEEIAGHTGLAVHDYQVLLDPADEDGFTRAWRPALMSPENHLAYALQWFVMAGTIVIIYAALTIRAARRKLPDD